MNKRYLFTDGLLLGGVLITSCVSPFYGTARIEKGWNADVGIGGMQTLVPNLDSWGYSLFWGTRVDGEISYGFDKYLQAQARMGIGFYHSYLPFFVDPGIGLQAALPVGPITPALRTEVSYYGGGVTFSPAVLLGIGRKERVTLGGRIHIFGNAGDDPHPEYGPYLEDTPTDFFVTVHLGRWNIFAGSQFFYHSFRYPHERPVATAGIGYKLK